MKTMFTLALATVLLGSNVPVAAAVYTLSGEIFDSTTSSGPSFRQYGNTPTQDSRSTAKASIHANSSAANSGTVVSSGFNSDANVFAYSEARFEDQLTFNGPAGSSARVRLTALGQMAKTGLGRATISMRVYDPNGGTIAFNNYILAQSVQNIRFTQSFIMPANSVYTYLMIASGNASGAGSYYAYLDPVITFNAGVPEPAVWAQLVAGFGLAGAVARRRRRTRVLAA